jgi:hypothetical protein
VPLAEDWRNVNAKGKAGSRPNDVDALSSSEGKAIVKQGTGS